MPVSAKTLRMLIDAGFAGDALVEVVASIEEDSQPARSSAAIRQERYRQRKASRGDVTGNVTLCDDPADSKERPHTPKENPPLQKKNPPLGVKKKSSPPSCLPSDWRASEAERAYAASLGFSAPETDRIEADFRDYWLAKAKDATKRDWTATWQRWCRQEADRRGKRPMPDAIATSVAPQVFVELGTDEWRAWKAHRGGRVAVTEERRDDGTVRRGWYFPTARPPPDLRATG